MAFSLLTVNFPQQVDMPLLPIDLTLFPEPKVYWTLCAGFVQGDGSTVKKTKPTWISLKTLRPLP
jgi:hypothetical protein